MPADTAAPQGSGQSTRNPPATEPTASAERRSNLRTIMTVAPYLWPADAPWVKRRVVIALVLLVLVKVIAVYTPLLFAGAVDVLSGEGVPPLALGAIGLTVAYGFARLAQVVFQQARDMVFARVSMRATRAIALETFRHIHSLSLRYHLTRKTGGLSRIIERGVKGVEFVLRFLLFSIGPLVLELTLIGAMLSWKFDPRYLLVVAITVVAYISFTFAITEARVRQRRIMNREDTNANQRAVDSLLNYETVKYFDAERREAARYDTTMAGYQRAAIKMTYSLGALNAGQSLIITCGLVVVMIMAATGVQSGALTVGDFVLVNAYMLQVMVPLDNLGWVYREIRQSLVDMGEMFDLREQPPEVVDAPDAVPLAVSAGRVELDAVHFAYDPARPILKGITLAAEPGQTVAIVGSTGSGKSTIGRLLFRFYDVGQGALRIDGQDVREVTQDSLHAAIGVVPQDTVLFNDTIRYNIAYGKDDATEAEVIAAAQAAQIHDFILGLPEGYDTPVGERGLKLSGGEKQRVGIARTLLKDPPILLLDEATSALDTDTEQEIKSALREAGQGRTVLTIAHRLSTIAEADLIVVLEKGEIVEQGTHDDLLTRDGRYAQLWHRQLADQD
ncbi:MAG: ABC transporter ATP-binding protein/permease [Pseudomonadota bacterium]